MRKRVFAIIISAIFILEIIAGAFLFIDIQVLQFPKTTITVDVVEINAEETLLSYMIVIDNPNSFDLLVKDVQILATTALEDEVVRIIVEGGEIPGKQNRTFSATEHITLTEEAPDLLTSTITGTLGIKFFGIIQKTLPLEITVITSLKEAIEHLALPTMSISVEFGSITSENIEFITNITVSNPNLFEMVVGDVTMTIDTETGARVGDFQITGATIPGKGSTTLAGHGSLLLNALNAKKLYGAISAEAGVTIAGMTKILPFSANMDIMVPSLQDLIPDNKPLELAIGIDFKLAKGGLLGDVVLEIDNPTKIPLYARDIFVQYYAVGKNDRVLLGTSALNESELAAENITILKSQILLPISGILNPSKGGVFPQSLFARLSVNLSISGVNQSLWVGLGSYVDMHPFRAN